MKTITRRHFVVGAAALGSALALGGCGAKPTGSEAPSSEQGESADIVVIGAGLAGISAARAAAEQGARVTLVEASASVGPLISSSPGNLTIVQVPENEEFWQFESEKADSVADFLERWRQLTEIGKRDVDYPDYERVKDIMLQTPESIAWLESAGLDFMQSGAKERDGMDFVKPDVGDSASTGGLLISDAFAAEFESLGVNVMFNTTATQLICDNGIVKGVRVSQGTKSRDIAAGAVVIATGGFGASDEWRAKLIPEVDEAGCQYIGGPLNKGDGMDMALACGAALYEDGWIIPFYIMPSKTLVETEASFADLNMYGTEGADPGKRLMVNAQGRRFVNEAAGSTELATTMVDSQNGACYVLFDASDQGIADILEKGLATQDLFKAGTIEELAAESQASELPAAFSAYQSLCAAGVDDEFSKAPESLVPYKEEGPYYLVRYVPTYVATMGGVKTNEQCQALDESGSPIEGLYVVGEATHRFMYNRSFVPCASNSSAIVMGRMTGEALGAKLSA
ncbi:FAD-dependent oxidoreductase [Rubneribacter sp.]